MNRCLSGPATTTKTTAAAVIHGKVGFGREFDLNTGPWQLELVSADTGKDAMARYSRPPAPEADVVTS